MYWNGVSSAVYDHNNIDSMFNSSDTIYYINLIKCNLTMQDL